jgi:hypothetical protein
MTHLENGAGLDLRPYYSGEQLVQVRHYEDAIDGIS